MKHLSIYLFALLALCFTSCNDDDDGDPGAENEVEEITLVNIEFTPVGGGPSVDFSFTEDSSDTIMLDELTTYSASVTFFNTEEDPAENVTLEVLEEDDEHLVCYTTNTDIDIAYADVDDNGLEVGLQTTVTTGAADSGTFNITLRHQPDLKNTFNEINCTIGSLDADVTFDIITQ